MTPGVPNSLTRSAAGIFAQTSQGLMTVSRDIGVDDRESWFAKSCANSCHASELISMSGPGLFLSRDASYTTMIVLESDYSRSFIKYAVLALH